MSTFEEKERLIGTGSLKYIYIALVIACIFIECIFVYEFDKYLFPVAIHYKITIYKKKVQLFHHMYVYIYVGVNLCNQAIRELTENFR